MIAKIETSIWRLLFLKNEAQNVKAGLTHGFKICVTLYIGYKIELIEIRLIQMKVALQKLQWFVK